MAELADAQDLGSCALIRHGGSIPPPRTYKVVIYQSGCSSAVERHVANVNVVGSIPITRSIFFILAEKALQVLIP